MKLLRFLGDSLKRVREFSPEARQNAGYQLDKVQRGEQPDDFRSEKDTSNIEARSRSGEKTLYRNDEATLK